MATIVNTPREHSNTGLIVGLVLAVLLLILFFVYGLPNMGGSAAPATDGATGGANLNVDVPGVGSGSGSAGGSVSGDGQ
ncbi:MAG: hypothetical protein H0U27_04045 [Nitrosopumilus sp.]|nr:hypothetical protein [Nitrosopumilus sp.]MBA3550656.1 hypothetical protein [Patescibacteria group bacterium]